MYRKKLLNLRFGDSLGTAVPICEIAFKQSAMGFNFSFFGRQEHRVFNYKPRYYDPEKEERSKRFSHVDGTNKKEEYAPGSYISGSFRDGNYQMTREANRYQRIIGVVALLLAFAVIILIAKYYPLLWQ